MVRGRRGRTHLQRNRAGLKDALARLAVNSRRAAVSWASNPSPRSRAPTGREWPTPSLKIAATRSFCAARRVSMAARNFWRNSPRKLIGRPPGRNTHTIPDPYPAALLANGVGKSTTLSEQVNIEPAVMASEIERLPDLEGFLKFASIPDWHCVELAPLRGPSCARSKPAPTAQTMSSAANTPTPADTPTPPAPAVQTVADMPTAESAQAAAPMPTVASTPTPANTSPSPLVTPCTATPHATTRRVSKQPRMRTRKPRVGIDRVDAAPIPEPIPEPHANIAMQKVPTHY